MLSSLQEMSIGARYRDDLAMPWERGMVGAALGHTMPLSVPKMCGNGDLGGFIESGMLEHKTSRRTLGRRLLPVAGLAFGICGFDWATPWLKVRAHCVINAALDKCLMRSPSIGCTWAASLIATSDLSTWPM